MKIYFFLFALFCIWIVYVEKTNQQAEPEDEKNEYGGRIIVCPKITPDILQSIPSSLEMLFLLKQIAYQYQDSSLNSVSNPNKYETEFEKALNLGIYNTDLSLANLYQKDQSSLVFFNIVKDLEYKLRIEQFFEYQMTKKEMILDLVLIQQNFEKINNRLQAQQRESTRILVLAGAWIESMYLASLAYEKQPNFLLREKIAEQKLNLEQILLVTDVHKTKANFADLILDLKKLEKIYKNIKIIKDPSYTTKMSEQNGLLQFKQIGGSCVEMNDTDFENLRKIIKFLRNKIVK